MNQVQSSSNSSDKIISSFDLSNQDDLSFLKDLSKKSRELKSQKNAVRDTGLVSILTSQMPSHDYYINKFGDRVEVDVQKPLFQIELPSPEYLRLKKLQKSVRVTAEVIEENIKKYNLKMRPAMVTLTYRPDVDWSPKHISNYIQCVKEWAKRRKLAVHYIWVMELTKKGVPHYHVMWWIPKGYSMPKADKQGWWKHGMTNSIWARKPVGYLCKYTSKGIDHNSYGKIPKNARLHGSGGLSASMRISKIWQCAPTWVRDLFDIKNGVKKVGCYWIDRVTLKGFSSPWLFNSVSRVLTFKGFGDCVDILEVEKCKIDFPKKIPTSVVMSESYSQVDFDFAENLYTRDTYDFAVLDEYFLLCSE